MTAKLKAVPSDPSVPVVHTGVTCRLPAARSAAQPLCHGVIAYAAPASGPSTAGVLLYGGPLVPTGLLYELPHISRAGAATGWWAETRDYDAGRLQPPGPDTVRSAREQMRGLMGAPT